MCIQDYEQEKDIKFVQIWVKREKTHSNCQEKALQNYLGNVPLEIFYKDSNY